MTAIHSDQCQAGKRVHLDFSACRAPQHAYGGLTLITTLIILLLLAIIGIAATHTTMYEERMSTNMRDKAVSFQAAESALREAEAWIQSLPSLPTPVATCAAKPCVVTLDPQLYFEDQTDAWWTANGALFTSASIPNVASQPRYFVQFYRFVPDTTTVGQGTPSGRYYYRITAKGTGRNSDTVTVLQTTATRRF